MIKKKNPYRCRLPLPPTHPTSLRFEAQQAAADRMNVFICEASQFQSAFLSFSLLSVSFSVRFQLGADLILFFHKSLKSVWAVLLS